MKILFKAMGEQSKTSDLGGIMGAKGAVICGGVHLSFCELKLFILSDFILAHILVVNHW